jgi:hypothetical protein
MAPLAEDVSQEYTREEKEERRLRIPPTLPPAERRSEYRMPNRGAAVKKSADGVEVRRQLHVV